MSHFTRCKTTITDKEALIAALGDLGYKNVEVFEKGSNLYGYQGDKRDQTAEIIVRRRHVGLSSNDIGFKRQEDGTYEAIISEFDSRKHNADWLKSLSQRYTFNKVTTELEGMGYSVGEVVTENGVIKFEAVSVGG